MKRSEVNAVIRDAQAFLERLQFHLPPFALWTPEDWSRKGPECREIVAHQLGWDITDFGSGRYDEIGLFLFTLRNGTLENLRAGRGKGYAEKIMIVRPHQVTPMHFHWTKVEDIINRGGGRLAIRLYQGTAAGDLERERPVEVSLDGVRRRVPAGDVVRLGPGESITLETGVYHEFWGEGGKVLVGEVSAVNDDTCDNRFLQPVGRFPAVLEDVPPLHLLVGDYPRYCPQLSQA